MKIPLRLCTEVVEVLSGQSAAYRAGIGLSQNGEEAFCCGLHLLTGDADDVAVGKSLLCHICSDDAVLFNQGSSIVQVGLIGYILGGSLVFLEEGLHSLRIGLSKVLAYNQRAHGELAAVLSYLVPFLGQIQSDADIGVLGQYAGNEGLRQYSDVSLTGSQQGSQLAVFALVFHSDIGADSHAILTEDIVEGIFGSSTLTGGVNGLAPEVFNRLDGVTVFYNIQYTQGVECQDLHLTLGLVVENRSHIGGNSSDIQFAFDEQGIDLICRASQSELIVIGGGAGGVAKFVQGCKDELTERLGLTPNTLVVIAAGASATKLTGVLIKTFGANVEGHMDKERYEFCWIVDFPMYEIGDESGELEFCHNPFSMPGGGAATLDKAIRGEIDPLTITAQQYDLVCNGIELSSGAVRNHDPEIMIKAFELVRLGESDVKKKFPAMYNAFCYGAPPHAGIAPGVDRMVMLLAGEDCIREIIPFPMNKNAQDILMGAPSEVTQKQLDELHIRCTAKEEE